jgi:hypothetical protein
MHGPHPSCIPPVVWQTTYFSPPLVHGLPSQKWTTRDRCHRQDIALVVWMVIDLIVNHRIIPLCNPTNDRRSLVEVDVITGIGHAKKVSNP